MLSENTFSKRFLLFVSLTLFRIHKITLRSIPPRRSISLLVSSFDPTDSIFILSKPWRSGPIRRMTTRRFRRRCLRSSSSTMRTQLRPSSLKLRLTPSTPVPSLRGPFLIYFLIFFYFLFGCGERLGKSEVEDIESDVWCFGFVTFLFLIFFSVVEKLIEERGKNGRF